MADEAERQQFAHETLHVYESRDGGWWNPDHGDVQIPAGWDLLPRGNAFLTRTVKELGPYWFAWQPRSRQRHHRRAIGVFAPAANIQASRLQADRTAGQRAYRRAQSARQRERDETRYRQQFAEAVVVFLNFAPEHAGLARQIADETAERASQIGSGRVGRTSKLTLAEKAELAVRAHIRHRYTDYENDLLGIDPFGDDEAVYRDVRHQAHCQVDDFLTRHRRTDASSETVRGAALRRDQGLR